MSCYYCNPYLRNANIQTTQSTTAPGTFPGLMPGTLPFYPSMQPIVGTPVLPTGIPLGPTLVSPIPTPSTTGMPMITTTTGGDVSTETVLSTEYTQGYLKSKIGSRVKIEFLIGTDMLVDREGTLMEVGTSYLIIREVDTDDLLLCDLYSIKFVRFYY